MNERPDDCREFRSRLERALEGRARPDELAPLSWHEHLLSCADCRALLEREEALEELLASWPGPRLSAPRRRALLASLRAEARGEAALDALLDRDRSVEAPADLARKVRARVDHERLDALLALDREAGIATPADLAARVREAADRERRPRIRLDRRWLWPAAAAAAALALVLTLPRGERAERTELAQVEPPADGARQPSAANTPGAESLPAAEEEELLAVLDLLEEDALWTEESLDLALAAEIDVEAEWLLEEGLYADERAAAEPDAPDDESAEGEDS